MFGTHNNHVPKVNERRGAVLCGCRDRILKLPRSTGE